MTTETRKLIFLIMEWMLVLALVLTMIMVYIHIKGLEHRINLANHARANNARVIDSLDRELSLRIYLDSVRIAQRKTAPTNMKYLEMEKRWQTSQK